MAKSKYTGIIALDLTAKGEVLIRCSRFDRIWLPAHVVIGGVIKNNPVDAFVQIRFETSGSDGEVWAFSNGYRNSESVESDKVYYKIITQGGSSQMYLQTGMGVAGGYGNTDGLSPVIGIGSTGAATAL